MAQADRSASLSHREVRSVVTGLMLAILLGALDQTIVSVALPMMSADLQGADLLGWVVSGYLIAMAVATPIYGKLGDLYGRRLMLSTAIGIFLLASVICALAQSMPMLVAARILQGLGGGGLISVAQAVIADVVAPRERGRYQGYVSGAFAVASVAGPLAGGLLTTYLSWRWVFWINLPLGLFALLVSRRALARLPVPRVKRSIDFVGAILLAAGLSALLIAVTSVGQGLWWLAPDNVKLLGIALACLIAFIWQERRSAEPIIPLWLFNNLTVAITCAILFIAFFQIVSLSVLIPLRLQMLTDIGADGAALRLLPLSLGIPVGAYVGGHLMTRNGRFKRIQLVGTLIVPVVVLALAFIDPLAMVPGLLCMALAGFGLGLQLPTATVAVQNSVPHRYVGIATAVGAFCRSLGAAIGIAILMAVLLATMQAGELASSSSLSGAEVIKLLVGDATAPVHSTMVLELKTPVDNAFRLVFVISAIVALGGCILAAFMPDDQLSERRPDII